MIRGQNALTLASDRSNRAKTLTPDATLSFRVAFEPKDSYIFARGQNIRIILPKPKELFELFGDEAKKRVRTATKI